MFGYVSNSRVRIGCTTGGGTYRENHTVSISSSRRRSKLKMAWRGQLSKNLKELRILFCQTSPASSSTRAFVEKNYKELKKVNPKLPILIRECSGTEPQLWTRYAFDMGVERGLSLEGMSEEQISKALQELNKAGASLKA